jgi:hypothetical protein
LRPSALVPHPLNFERDRTDDVAAERRTAGLVAEADAEVVVWDRIDRDPADLLGRCRRKSIPVRVFVPGRPDEAPTTEPSPPRRMLPD